MSDDKKLNALFEKTWGFSRQDFQAGKVAYSIDDWFEDLDKELTKALSVGSFKDSSDEERERFKCLVYMACSTQATESTPRDLSDKTFPHFQAVKSTGDEGGQFIFIKR